MKCRICLKILNISLRLAVAINTYCVRDCSKYCFMHIKSSVPYFSSYFIKEAEALSLLVTKIAELVSSRSKDSPRGVTDSLTAVLPS